MFELVPSFTAAPRTLGLRARRPLSRRSYPTSFFQKKGFWEIVDTLSGLIDSSSLGNIMQEGLSTASAQLLNTLLGG